MTFGALLKTLRTIQINRVIDESWRHIDQAFLRQGCSNHQPGKSKLETKSIRWRQILPINVGIN